MRNKSVDVNKELFSGIKTIIEQGRQQVAQSVNAGLTATYWHIGKLIREDILKNKRADYGKQILRLLSTQLVKEYGSSFSVKSLHRMVQFNERFPDLQIVATLWRQLSWSHFKLLIPLKNNLEHDFYVQMCRIENWSVRTLQKKIIAT